MEKILIKLFIVILRVNTNKAKKNEFKLKNHFLLNSIYLKYSKTLVF